MTIMPSRHFSGALSGETETITVDSPGYTTSTDAHGNPTRVKATAATVADVDIQPLSGSSRLLPEAVRSAAQYQGFVDLNDDASDKRSAVKAGRIITRANGDKLRLTYVADHTTHLLLALATVGET